MKESSSIDYSQRIAKYMKMGWKLTEYSCPICGSLIVKKEDDYFCPVCEKRVVIAESEEEALNIYKQTTLKKLESVILRNIDKITSSENLESNLDTLMQYIKILRDLRDLVKQ